MGALDNILSDDLDALLNSPTTAPKAPPASYTAPTYTEPCKKCRGSGRFTGWSGRSFGQCFACKGAGSFSFKSSPEKRAAGRASADARKARKAGEAMEAFKQSEPAVWAWMDGSDFPFAVAMREALAQWGHLTERQLAACKSAIEKRDAARAAAAERIVNAPAADAAGIDRLKAAFDKAVAYTAAKQTDTGMPLRLRSPKITIGNITISPAKATSKNPGALYVKDAGEYMGKIAGGKFLASRECSDEQRSRILAFIADPKAAAEAYGKETGVCCVCNATLTSKWRLAGIGPVCAEKMGW